MEVTVDGFLCDDCNPWSKFGIMFCETTDNDSKHFSLLITKSNGVHSFFRSETGSPSFRIEGKDHSFTSNGGWMKITRSGNWFRSYFKATVEERYELIGELELDLAANALRGLALSSHDKYASVSFSDFKLVSIAQHISG